MKNMHNLLDALSIKEDVSHLQNAILKEVKINELESTFCFTIECETFIPVKEFSLFEEALLGNFPYQSYFHLVVNNKQNQQIVLDYMPLLCDYLKDSVPLLKSLKKEEFKVINDMLEIYLLNDAHLELFNHSKTLIEENLKRFGFNLHVNFLIKEDDEQYLNVVQDLDNEIIMDRKVEREKPVEFVKPVKTEYRRGMNQATTYQISEIKYDARNVLIEGFVFKYDTIETRNGKIIQTFYITDFKDSIMAKRFLEKHQLEELSIFEEGKFWGQFYGEIRFDTFAGEQVMMIQKIQKIGSKIPERDDKSSQKRVEIHTHTKMSTMDGVGTIDQYVKQAVKWGHKAIAITDHTGVQSFPDAQYAAKKYGLEKMIYGVEVNVIETEQPIVFNSKAMQLNGLSYVSFDFETTGLSSKYDEIIEFGGVKVVDGLVVDRLQFFVKPSGKLSRFTTQLTGITDEMVNAGVNGQIATQMIRDFVGDLPLVAHNASFDLGFLNALYLSNGYSKIDNPIIDTLPLSHIIHYELRYHRLGTICRHYRIPYDDNIAHRADYDADVLYQVFQMMLAELNEMKISNMSELNHLRQEKHFSKIFSNHAMLLAKNQAGLKDMFKLVSLSNIQYYYGQPKLPKNIVHSYRKDLLVGAGCLNSEVFEYAMNKSDEELIEILKFYDYVEVQPLENYAFMVDIGKVPSIERIQQVIKRIIEFCKKSNVLIVASGDVHYLDPMDKIYRDVYIVSPGIGGAIHPLFDRKGRIKENPDQHFRTTDEMLHCFDYLGEELAFELVVTNSNLIADQIEQVTPLKKDLYTPKIEGADEKLTQMCYDNAKRIYGDPLPEYVKERLERELNSIIKHGFGVIYYISHQLVKKSLDDGYLVGSRGSVGSSFVATMSEITEVNPLKPHYVCPNCQFSEFFFEGNVMSGYDLPDKDCPHCQTKMIGDGQDIPFETFLGFEGDKVPDIDLNFSGEYQARAHHYTKVLFGEDKVFRAGTISTVAEKTAFGYAKGYAEHHQIQDSIRNAELTRLASGCEGVKRTSGQHPGGIIVIPNDMDVYDFTPIQFPADDVNSEWKTTHFDFHAIHDNVLKLDILGHVDPTAIRMLQDLTGVDPKTIPTNDKDVMSLFNSIQILNIKIDEISKNGALGIPEFGTSIGRATLDETMPSTFNELVILSGLSHGTGVWAGNAQDLIRSGQCTLKEVIGCRDDIMVYLIAKGLPPKLSFDIMESVRKGKGVKDEWVEMMKENNVPSWYIESCMKIQYMFPKAHAVAYVLMAVRVAWFKVYYPREYYATFFTTRCSNFDIETMIDGKEAVISRMNDIQDRIIKRLEVTPKEKELIPVFELCVEMFERGYYFTNIDLMKSEATKFSLSKDDSKAIVPPFASLDGLGDNVAKTIVEARLNGPFISKEDLMKRTQLNNTSLKKLDALGVTQGMQDENQLSLF